MHTLLHSVPPVLQQATADPRLCWRLRDTHGQVWVGSVSCGVTAPCSWVLAHTRFCLWPPRLCFPVLCKFWWLYGGITEKAREFQENIYFCFIDYAKAFDCVDHSKLWKILKEKGIPDHLTCLLRNLYAGQEETVRTGHGTTDWFRIGKGVRQGCILSLCLFNLYAEDIMRNARPDEA